MALKDWRRTSKGFEHRWLNRRIFIGQNLKGGYNVVLINSKNKYDRNNLKVHVTKPQALKFAKSYMRTH